MTTGSDETRRHLRGSSVLLAGRMVAMVISMCIQLVLVRGLSREGFGAFAYGLSISSSLVFIIGLGQSQALNRFLALYDEEGTYGRFRGALVLATVTVVTAGSVVAGAIWVFRDQLASSVVDDPLAISVLSVLVLLAPLEALDRVAVACLAVMSRPRAIAFRKHLLTPVAQLVAVAVAVAAGVGVVGIARAYVAIGFVGFGTYVLLVGSTLRSTGRWDRFWSGRLELPGREIYGFALPLLTTEILFLSINAGSAIVLGWVDGTAEVARYRAIFPAARLNQLAIFTFTTLFIPLAARHFARGDDDGMRHSYRSTAMWLCVLTLPIFLLTVPFAQVTTQVMFGSEYASSAIVLAVLAGGYFVNAVMGFNAHTLQAYGRVGWLVWGNVVAFAVNVALTLTFAPRWGATGVAAANAIALVAHNIVNQLNLRRLLGPVLRGSGLRVWVAAALAAVGCAGVAATEPHPVVALASVMVASAAVLRVSRHELDVSATFPELARVPVLSKLLR